MICFYIKLTNNATAVNCKFSNDQLFSIFCDFAGEALSTKMELEEFSPAKILFKIKMTVAFQILLQNQRYSLKIYSVPSRFYCQINEIA